MDKKSKKPFIQMGWQMDLTQNGHQTVQKIEQGIYKDRNLDGRRILWTSDGEVREDQFYENGKMLEPVAKKNEIMDDVLKVENEDPILAKYLENIGEDGNGLEVARGSCSIC